MNCLTHGKWLQKEKKDKIFWYYVIKKKMGPITNNALFEVFHSLVIHRGTELLSSQQVKTCHLRSGNFLVKLYSGFFAYTKVLHYQEIFSQQNAKKLTLNISFWWRFFHMPATRLGCIPIDKVWGWPCSDWGQSLWCLSLTLYYMRGGTLCPHM